MSSATAARLGIQTPQIVRLPPAVHSHAAAEEAIELAEEYGLELDDSQRVTINAAMGTREDETWAASEVADFEPRQNGKNDAIQAREMWGLFVAGEMLQIHTAHEFATANESFMRMERTLDSFPALRKQVFRFYRGHGDQAIHLRSGARLLYKARTGGSQRGFAEADLVVYDEAQHANKDHMSASAPSTLVNPNPQLWFAGSGGLSTSELAWDLRIRALSTQDAGRLAYVEHTAEDISLDDAGRPKSKRPTDILDPAAWALANPAYGTRISDEGLMTMYRILGEDRFARECLCIWDPLPEMGSGGPISLGRWAELVDPDSTIVGSWAAAIDVSPDLKWTSVAAAGRRADGHLHVEVTRRQPGTEWVIDFAKRKAQELGIAFRIAATSPAGFLIPLLEEAYVPVVSVAAQEVTQACARFIAAVGEGTVHHLGGGELPAALSNATIAQHANGATSWSRVKSAGDISSLVAATIAVGGVSESTDGGDPFFLR